MIKAVIFDMDGVIVDSEPLWEKEFTTYLKQLGKNLPQNKSFDRFVNTKIRGKNQKQVTAIFRKKFGLKGSYQKIMRDRLKILFSIFNKELKTIPGAIPLMKKLHKRKYPLVLASSSPKPVIHYILSRYKLKKYFKAVISGDDFTRAKPHPEIFLKCARLFREKPKNILVIEDSINGVKAAKKAGMKCIALKQSYTPYKRIKSADLIVKSLSKITLSTIKNL